MSANAPGRSRIAVPSRSAASSQSGCGSPARSAIRMPQRSAWCTLDDPVSSAPRSPAAHQTSPPGA
ncbi:MAG TPA: hypothetical protein VN408_15705 [Actinoplanes sp.]|nr:hypothetical protein [Actinoplanes sp.]